MSETLSSDTETKAEIRSETAVHGQRPWVVPLPALSLASPPLSHSLLCLLPLRRCYW